MTIVVVLGPDEFSGVVVFAIMYNHDTSCKLSFGEHLAIRTSVQRFRLRIT